MTQRLQQLSQLLRVEARRVARCEQRRNAQAAQVSQQAIAAADAQQAHASTQQAHQACEERMRSLPQEGRSFLATEVVAYQHVLDTLLGNCQASERASQQAQRNLAQAQHALAEITTTLHRARERRAMQQERADQHQKAMHSRDDDQQDEDAEDTGLARAMGTFSRGG